MLHNQIKRQCTIFHCPKVAKKFFSSFNKSQGVNIWIILVFKEKQTLYLTIHYKGGVFFHDAESKISEIFEYIEKLQTTAKDKLTAWIIGGQGGEQTTRKVNTIAEVLCDRPDIDTSIIAGQKSIAPNLTIYPTTEKLDITIGLPKKDDLENYFDIVELNNTKFTA